MADKNTLRNWFLTNLKPTQAQFWALFDSYWHKDEKIAITAIEDIENILNAKADAEALSNHVIDAGAHATLFDAKEDKSQKGAASGYAPLDEFIKIAAQYLSIVDDLVTGGSTSILSAEQGKLLQTQVTAINTLLTSNDVNLDTVQEIVDAIKTVETSLSTILVNDLTTGGTTKALTAEMGKTLKGLDEEKLPLAGGTMSGHINQPTQATSNSHLTNKAYVDTKDSTKMDLWLTVNTQNGTNYSFVYDDTKTKLVKFTSALPVQANFPLNSVVNISIGARIKVLQVGDGVVTFGGAGITFVSNIPLSMVKGETREFTKTGADEWAVEGSQEVSVKSQGVIYLSSAGSDVTGEKGNKLKPFQTLDAAYAVYSSVDSNYNTFEFLSPSVFYFNGTFDGGNVNFVSKVGSTFSLLNNTNALIQSDGGLKTFDMPNGIIDFRSSTAHAINVTQIMFKIKAKQVITDATFSITRVAKLDMDVELLSHNGGVFVDTIQTVSTNESILLKVGRITNTGGGTFLAKSIGFLKCTVDFDEITTDGAFMVCGGQLGQSPTDIFHGNYTSTLMTAYTYIEGNQYGKLVSIFYKNNAKIKGNVRFAKATFYLTGNAEYFDSTNLFYHSLGGDNGGNVWIDNAVIKCKTLHFGLLLPPFSLTITDSYIEVDQYLLNNGYATGAMTAPLVKFIGSNTVYCRTLTANYILVHVGTTNPYIDVIGTLKTNGKLQAGIIQNNYIVTTEAIKFTPTTSELVNTAYANPQNCTYIRIGDVVTATYRFALNETAGSSEVTFRCTLPINRLTTGAKNIIGVGSVVSANGSLSDKIVRGYFDTNDNSTFMFRFITQTSIGTVGGYISITYLLTE